MKPRKIAQVELQLARKLDTFLKNALQELNYLPPQNYRAHVSFLDNHGRKKRSNASAENWSPESGRIQVRFEPATQDWKPEVAGTVKELSASIEPGAEQDVHTLSGAGLHPAEIELLKALNRAESRPGWHFVSLKKFRDEILPAEPAAARAPKLSVVEWDAVLRSAIDKRLVLVGKVANPRSPQFPVTTVRLNRLAPGVQTALGGARPQLDFHPIPIKGEPLSATILRERR